MTGRSRRRPAAAPARPARGCRAARRPAPAGSLDLEVGDVPVTRNGCRPGQQTAVEQHPDRLDRVQRHALGASRILRPSVSGNPGTSPSSMLSIDLRPGLQADRWRPRRARRKHLRAPEREDEDRVLGRPFEQVVDEVQKPRVGPLEILEHEHDRLGRAIRSKNSRQPVNRSARSVAVRCSSPSRCASRGSTRRRSRSSGELLDHGPELLAGAALRLEDPARPRTISASAQ